MREFYSDRSDEYQCDRPHRRRRPWVRQAMGGGLAAASVASVQFRVSGALPQEARGYRGPFTTEGPLFALAATPRHLRDDRLVPSVRPQISGQPVLRVRRMHELRVAASGRRGAGHPPGRAVAAPAGTARTPPDDLTRRDLLAGRPGSPGARHRHGRELARRKVYAPMRRHAGWCEYCCVAGLVSRGHRSASSRGLWRDRTVPGSLVDAAPGHMWLRGSRAGAVVQSRVYHRLGRH